MIDEIKVSSGYYLDAVACLDGKCRKIIRLPFFKYIKDCIKPYPRSLGDLSPRGYRLENDTEFRNRVVRELK